MSTSTFAGLQRDCSAKVKHHTGWFLLLVLLVTSIQAKEKTLDERATELRKVGRMVCVFHHEKGAVGNKKVIAQGFKLASRYQADNFAVYRSDKITVKQLKAVLEISEVVSVHPDSPVKVGP